MKNIHLIIFPFAFLLLSCAEYRVSTRFVRSFDSVDSDSVIVLQQEAVMPSSVDTIGTVTVKSTLLKSAEARTILSAAVAATAEAGGNVLKLTKVDYRDHPEVSYHVMAVAARSSGEWQPEQSAICMPYASLLPYEERNLSVSELAEYLRKRPLRNTVSLTVGFDGLCSDVTYPGNMYGFRGGLNWRAEYYHCLDLFAFGFVYDGAYSSFANDYYQQFAYFGPQMMLHGHIAQRWRLRFGVGLGYCLLQDNEGLNHGIGAELCGGIEYLLNRRIGIGVNMHNITGSIKGEKGHFLFDNDGRWLLHRFAVTAGLNIHF